MPASPPAVDRQQLDLPPAARSVPVARRWVAARLAAGRAADLVGAAELLTTEVVTNAVLHAGTAVSVSVTTTPAGVRVAVTDGSAVPLVRRPPPGPTATTGRGSLLLDAVAARWGSTVGEAGKEVWFELDLEHGPDGTGGRDEEADGVG